MYFVYRTSHSPHGNCEMPDWCLIDFKEKGLKTGWKLNERFNREKHAWGQDIYEEIKANPEKFLIVEAEDYAHLQQTKEYKEKWDEYVMSAVKPDSHLGWISPDGTFIGCDYYDHSFIAEEYLHSDEKTLEKEGWVKLYSLGPGYQTVEWYTKTCRITAAQNEMFIKLGMGDHYDFVI